LVHPIKKRLKLWRLYEMEVSIGKYYASPFVPAIAEKGGQLLGKAYGIKV
jgi:hypothetical protein